MGEDDDRVAWALRERQHLADWLRRRIRMRRLSQRHLAMRAGVSPSSVSRLMANRHMPSLRTVQRLTDALGEPVPVVGTGWLTPERPRPTMDPTRRVEEALRSDPTLTPLDVSLVMRRYHAVRAQADDSASLGSPVS